MSKLIPLTPMQEMMFAAALSDNKKYFTAAHYKIKIGAEFDLKTRFETIINRHEILRTTLKVDGSKPFMCVSQTPSAVLYETDKLPEGPFVFNPLSDEFAVKIFIAKDELLLIFSHIFLDGWSTAIILDELLSKNAPFGTISPFRYFIKWQNSRNVQAFDFAKFEQATLPFQKETTDYERGELCFSPQSSSQITDAAKSLSVPLGRFIEALWGILCTRYADADTFVAAVDSGRSAPVPGITKIAGMFVSVLPISAEISDETTFAEFVKNFTENAANSLKIGYLPPTVKLNSLVSVEFSNLSQNEHFTMLKSNARLVTDFDFVAVLGDEICFRFEYNKCAFSEFAVLQIRDHFLNILNVVLQNQDVKIVEIDFLTKLENEFIFRSSKDDELLRFVPIPVQIDRIINTNHAEFAVISGDIKYSYEQLNSMVVSVSSYLINKKRGGGVLISLPRSAEFIIAEIAVMKAGLFFIPVDPKISREKLEETIKTISPEFIISSENINELIAYKGDANSPKITPQMAAYAIMTSGTTGKPKGVLVSHASISHYLAWAARTYYHSCRVSSALIYGFTFDGAFGSIFGPLLCGGTVHILDDETRFDIVKTADYCSQNRITNVDLPASMLPEFTKIIAANRNKSPLEFIITGGEQIKRFSDCKIPVSNEYGPTECTVCVTQSFLHSDTEINIGNEIPNNKIYVLDSRKKPLPLGIMGECYAAGIGVAIKYIGDENSTAFFDNPFGIGKMYKTGDRVRFARIDGSFVLQFSGRNDGQIKHNGYRIETGEIEEAARKYCGVGMSVAAMQDSYIALYAVCENAEMVTAKLREVLPHYMLPVVIPVNKIPLTESGKPDLRALSQIRFEQKNENIIAASPKCKMLCELILKIAGINITETDNFTAMGGNSITAMKISFALSERGIILSPSDIIISKSIAQSAEKIINKREEQVKINEFTPPNSLKSMIYLSQKYDNRLYTVTAQTACFASFGEVEKRILKSAKIHDILRTNFSVNAQKQITAVVSETPNIKLITETENFPQFIDPLSETLVYVILSDNKLTIRYHHIVLDGYSVNLLFSELAEGVYPDTSQSYAAFANSFSDSESDYEFYKIALEETVPITLFENQNAPQKLSVMRYFEREFTNEIKVAAAKKSLTPAVFIMSAFGVYLSIFGNTEKVIVPVIASFRNAGGLMGSAAQTFPIIFERDINSNKFAITAKRFHENLSETVKHINIPEEYLRLPYIFVDDDRAEELSDIQNYSLVITSGGALLYDAKCISESLITSIAERLRTALDNALSDRVSIYKSGEFELLTNTFAVGKNIVENFNYLSKISNQKAFEICKNLTKSGIKSGNLVAIEATRTNEALNYYAAVSLSGAAVLPIDADLPGERKAEIIADSKPSAIIKNGEITLFVNGEIYDPQTAYVIYTSGSTGKPKGVRISKTSLQSQVNSTIGEFGFGENDKILHFINFAFDPSIWIIYSAFASGATAEIAPENIRTSPDLVAKFICENNITIAVLPAAAAYDILSNLRENSLRYVFLGGDKIHIPKRTKFTENIEIINLYGPTETCINASFYRLPKDCENTANIGKPVGGTNIYIFDKELNLSPIGVRGEIYIGGDKISTGYINRPNETANAFITHKDFGRVYKTGDIAAWNEDGTIEFIGRSDRQVKIRGFRVELSEIETVITEIISARASVIFENGALFAFAETELSEQFILDKLRKKLPGYMVPNRVINLEKLPINTNGKIDIKSLKIPQNEADFMPLSKTEKIIANAFKEVLGLDSGTVTRNDDFFALGGHSLKLFALTGSLAAKGITPGINDIISNPVVKNLAEIADISDGDFNLSFNIANAFDKTSYDRFIAKCKTADIIKKRNPKTVMITGATGFLGAHILCEIMRETHAQIVLPVRGEISRVDDTLRYYFPGEDFDFSRLSIICCDLSKNKIETDKKIDIIYHSAADIRHYASFDESYSANVTATENIIRFAKEQNAYLAHISTASSVNLPIITEDNFDTGANFDNVYQRTKQAAERLIFSESGLDFGVFRVGNITPSLQYRIHARNADTNAYLHLLTLIIKAQSLPPFRGRSGYCFADLTAKAICLLADCETLNRQIFHITNQNILTFAEIFDMMNITPIANSENLPDELRGIYAQRTLEKKTDVSADIKNDATRLLLSRLGFEWTAPTLDYLKAFLNYE
jgi:non-ribosomal peptide synthetase component F/thioester reductase-like protein